MNNFAASNRVLWEMKNANNQVVRRVRASTARLWRESKASRLSRSVTGPCEHLSVSR